MGNDYVLAIDVGTQSVRALLFDLRGNLIEKSRVTYEPYYSEQPGWAEQSADQYWNSLGLACRKLWQQTSVPKEAVAAVSLTTQRSTTVNVNKEGKPLRPAIVWLDQRRTSGLKPVSGPWGLIFKLIGMTGTISYLQAEAEVNWIRTYQPEIWNQTHKYLFLSGYLTYLLTGRFADSVGCQVGYVPFDYKNQSWAAPHDWKWQAVPMDKSLLPDLVPCAGTLGQITAQASAITGIPAGLPLIAAAGDKACEVIGAGCVEPHVACLGYGTTATINTTNKKYVEVIPLIPPYPAAIPETYSLEVQIARGYWMVNWFKEEFAHYEQIAAKECGLQPEQLFDDLVNKVPPGSMGLVLQPYWSPGLKMPGPLAKGAVIGFGGVHTRAHFYRSILEGLAYALREGKERIENRSRIPIKELRVAGGGSQSDAVMQLTADIFGLPAARPHIYESSGLGAGIDAAVGLKLHSSFDIAAREMTRIGRTFDPNPSSSEIYDQLYHRVYKHLYNTLKPLYESIADITGYPNQTG